MPKHMQTKRINSLRRLIAAAMSAAVVMVGINAPAISYAAASVDGQGFVPVQQRILDTRAGGIGGYNSPMPANTWRSVPTAGIGSIPSTGVLAVAATVTVLSPASAGTAWLVKSGASGTVYPVMNYGNGSPTSAVASTIVELGTDGNLQVRTATAVDVVVDVQGYYLDAQNSGTSAGYTPVQPQRLYDTASGQGGVSGKRLPNTVSEFQITGLGDVPASATAAFVQLTTTVDDAQTGYIRVGPPGSSGRSSLNFQPSTSTIIGATLSLGTTGSLVLEVVGRSTGIHVSIDVIGYYTAASDGYFTTQASRVFDSRSSANGPLAAQERRVVQIAGVAGVPSAAQLPSALAADVHVLHPGAASGSVEIRPTESVSGPGNVWYSPNSSRTDFVLMELGLDGTVTIENRGSDSINIVIDVVGWFRFPTQSSDLADLTERSPDGTSAAQVQAGVEDFAAANGFSYEAALSRLAREARAKVPAVASPSTTLSGTDGLPIDEPQTSGTTEQADASTQNDSQTPGGGGGTYVDSEVVPEGGGGGGGTNVTKVQVYCSGTGNYIASYAATSVARYGHNAMYVIDGCKVIQAIGSERPLAVYPSTSKVSSMIEYIVNGYGKKIALYHNRAAVYQVKNVTSAERRNASNWALSKVGAIYNGNFAFNRTYGPKFNCSQIVWAAWRATKGVDLDKDGGWGVYPRDLRDSPRASFVRWVAHNA